MQVEKDAVGLQAHEIHSHLLLGLIHIQITVPEFQGNGIKPALKLYESPPTRLERFHLEDIALRYFSAYQFLAVVIHQQGKTGRHLIQHETTSCQRC